MPAKREVIGLWPRFYATIQLLCHRSREHIFVVLQEATTSIFFCCCIVRMPATAVTMHRLRHMRLYFYVLSQ